MSSIARAAPATKFYQQDVVRLASDPNNALALVLRCWYDPEDFPISDEDPLMRPLQRGEVGIAPIGVNGQRQILPETDLILVDRTMQPGDFVKRSIEDVQSGVVLDLHVRSKLEHAINHIPIEGWKEPTEVQSCFEAETGDFVIYNDWIGQIIELCDENIVEVSNGHILRMPEFGARWAVGEKGTDIIPHNHTIPPFFNFLLNRNATQEDTVIQVSHSVYAIAWLAINQKLPPAEASERVRPPQFWYGAELAKLTVVREEKAYQPRIGDRVNLVTGEEVPSTTHGPGVNSGEYVHVNALIVKQTETSVRVLWQDGTEEMCRSVDLIPYLNTDEYDCWPGDTVIWRGEDFKESGVVQTVDARQRVASLYLLKDKKTETVSVLELDTQGTDPDAEDTGHDGLGVRIGDYVFIHPEGTTNGYTPPHIPRIGEMEEWVREIPAALDSYTGWRGTLWDIGNDVLKHRGTDPKWDHAYMQTSCDSTTPIDWCGDVVKLGPDGTVLVRHPDGSKATYPLERLSRLMDAMEHLEEATWDAMHSHEHHHDDLEYWDDEEGWSADPHGVDGDHLWVDEDMDQDPQSTSLASNADSDSEMDEVDSRSSSPPLAQPYTPETAMALSQDMEVENPFPIEDVRQLIAAAQRDREDMDEDDVVDKNGDSSEAGPSRQVNEEVGEYNRPWKRFEILEEAPADHKWYGSPVAQPNRQFHARLNKEYGILRNSLPENIIVRTYEDRSDLLRSLIIGPENTPYEDAPFVIDWMLDSDFPNSPPKAHFLSWTNGNGRVNPNLYEEGKVCLSILGTWAGDTTETWSAARSSLLQAFVSIQGLVLVKEPWFCEPAYEKLRGTEEGIVNSRLYSEKAYVLSRGFVRRALEIPLGDVAREIKHIYWKEEKLRKVLSDAKALVEKSRKEKDHEDTSKLVLPPTFCGEEPAVPSLTSGGILSLSRTLGKLQELLDKGPPEGV
ncbi:hypothetical protein CYLTODRAFT_420028 [Cylindrobasidium torrendii FP15055 ss-10]|uniref:UBC core domain-containing protein n=1 Tax=Cylindrobasidium torrendii FP15055 ss-10 TaxID=1314674 RepID=A0A0D7BJC2_9AGAR|nr:hypothetical protein CYLTODRAFT_420028 [Cylindrobasidium torrendii FP15055 ss-10]